MAGVGLKEVQELMGHKTITMTARYAHLAPAHKLAALEKLVNRQQPAREGGREQTGQVRHEG
jgi:site-specific recombinase XerD